MKKARIISALIVLVLVGSLLLWGQTPSSMFIQIQNAGSNILSTFKLFRLNCSTNLTCSASGNTVTITAQGGGSGSVTNVTFTGDGTVLSSTPSTAVTTTGTLTAALANAGAGTVLGNATGSAAAPTYTAQPVLGLNGGTGGQITLNGSTSGNSVLSVSSTGVFALPSGTTATNLTMTTPILGTPQSGTLTNATGLPENGMVGAAAAATLTEAGTGFAITQAGVETANLTYPHVFQNTNNTNTNTSGALGINTVGASGTGQVALIINETTAAGDLLDAYTAGSFANGVFTAGTLRLGVSAAGGVTATSYKGLSFSSATTTGNVTMQGGSDGSTNATLGTLTVRGADNSGTGGSVGGGPLTLRGGDLTAGATNLPGAAVIIRSGLGTGNATPATVKIQSPTLGLASGTAAESSITWSTRHAKAGSTTSATATTLFNIASATNTAWGVDIVVHVDLISSTPNVCGTTERFSLTGTNNNGAFGTVNIVAGTLSTLCSAGTLTLAVTATAANPSVISVTPTWATITSITSATITVVIENPSQQEIGLL